MLNKQGDMSLKLSRCCTAKGPSTGFSQFSPTKVKACKFFYSLKVRVENSRSISPPILYMESAFDINLPHPLLFFSCDLMIAVYL